MSAQVASNRKERWNKPISDIGTVTAAIRYLSMPETNRNALLALFESNEKLKFKASLEECVGLTNTEPSMGTKVYLFGLVSCISEIMLESLTLLGYTDIDNNILVDIGARAGTDFRTLMNAAINKREPNHHQTLAEIESILLESAARIGARPFRLPPRPRPVAERPAKVTQPAQTPTEESEQPMADKGDEDKGFLSTHVYGGRAALCFNAALSQNNENHTVIVDAALSIGERKYDWKNAIKIQLGHKELPLLLGVLLGWKNSVKFDAHGATNDKCFEIVRQDDKFFAKVFAKDKPPCAIPMGAQDAYPVAMIVLSQIIKQAPKTLQEHPEILIQMMKLTQNIKPVVA